MTKPFRLKTLAEIVAEENQAVERAMYKSAARHAAFMEESYRAAVRPIRHGGYAAPEARPVFQRPPVSPHRPLPR